MILILKNNKIKSNFVYCFSSLRRNDENRTALMLAAMNDHVETMSILIENSCDIHAIDKERVKRRAFIMIKNSRPDEICTLIRRDP